RRHARGRQRARGRAVPSRRAPRRDAGNPGAALARDARRPREVIRNPVDLVSSVVPAPRASKTRVNALMLGTHIPEAVAMGPRFRGDDKLRIGVGGPMKK